MHMRQRVRLSRRQCRRVDRGSPCTAHACRAAGGRAARACAAACAAAPVCASILSRSSNFLLIAKRWRSAAVGCGASPFNCVKGGIMKRTLLMAALAAGVAGNVAASCGSAFCMVNTNWNAQGAWIDPGARVDLRFEYMDQDQPRAGSRKVGVGEIRQHHDEVRTINRNWIGTFDYMFNERWGVSATLPMVGRDHSHIHHHMGEDLPEAWHFTELGDARILGRRQWRAESVDAQRLDFFGATFGLKLPTGKTDVRNADGELAERTLQPGSGTTDLLFGGYFRRVLGSGSSWFGDVLVQQPLDTHEQFKPGRRVSLDLGYRRGPK